MKLRLVECLDSRFMDNDYLPIEYSRYSKNQVSNILARGINDQAIHRQDVVWITIDWAESRDLDDAIWAERMKNWYCVWIHISDVSEFIKIYSPLDLEAFRRTASIYRRDHIINQLPEALSNDLLSLNQNWKKATLTLKVELDEQAMVKKYSYIESFLTNLKRYDYGSFWEDFSNKDSEFYDKLHLFQEISNKLLINRLKSWGVIWYKEDDRRAYIWEKKGKDWGNI